MNVFSIFIREIIDSRTDLSLAMMELKREKIIRDRTREQRWCLTRAVFTKADTRVRRVSRQTVAERLNVFCTVFSSSLLGCLSRAQSTYSETTKLSMIILDTLELTLGFLGIVSSLCCHTRLKKNTFSDRNTFLC